MTIRNGSAPRRSLHALRVRSRFTLHTGRSTFSAVGLLQSALLAEPVFDAGVDRVAVDAAVECVVTALAERALAESLPRGKAAMVRRLVPMAARFLVLHYWNPAHLIPLVEIVPHPLVAIFDVKPGRDAFEFLPRCRIAAQDERVVPRDHVLRRCRQPQTARP